MDASTHLGQSAHTVYAVMEEGGRVWCLYGTRADADKYVASLANPLHPGRFFVREYEVIWS